MLQKEKPIRYPHAGLVLVVAMCLIGIGLGCGTRPPALPPITPDQLPSVWLDSLSARVCPEPHKARLVLRVEPQGRRGVTLDGTLNAALPDTIQIGVKLGAFRPLFALRADADSSQLLVHGEASYWTTPRGSPDWSVMNPSAWVAALGWALCPRELYLMLEPDGPGRVEGGRWHLEGRLRGTPFNAALEVDVSNGSLMSLKVFDQNHKLLDVTIARHLSSAAGWLPTTLDLVAPGEGLKVRIYLENITSWTRDDGVPEVILSPDGWRRVRESLPIPVPDTRGQ